MEDRIMSIRVKDDDTSDALVYVIKNYDVIGGSIERRKDTNDYAMVVLTEHVIITTSFKDGECEGFTIAKDSVKPEKQALIVLMAAVSDNNFDSLHIEWDIDTYEYMFTFNKDE